jgi:uncharacterized membrane protein
LIKKALTYVKLYAIIRLKGKQMELWNLGLWGIMISGPIADIMAVILSIIFVFFEFKNIEKLKKEMEMENELS